MERKLLLIGLVLLSAACLGLGAWILALTGGNPLWVLALGLGILLLLVLIFIAKRLHALFSANRLERGLIEQGKAQLRSTRPDRRHETEQLHNHFVRAVRELKGSKLGRGGRDALYALPWYAMIGPSGAGKTTALRNSGLRFPNMRGQENVKVRGLGGTRNCDFWLTNDAVLLDTAGRWSTQEDDHHEWLGFLQLLRKHRGQKPLNGLIAAIGVSDIVNASEAEIDALAQRMRERLEEVTSELRISLPVYVLFTKCDLLEGFVEMFGALRSTEREQIFGFTVPLASVQLSADRLFEEQFGELTDSLRSASITRMGEERGARERQLVYAFPGQFDAMQKKLAQFMTRLFERNVYQETLPLRGVYFSSGTQEGRPFSLLAEPRSQQDAGAPVDQKGYFLRELFMQVIFEDRAIASASQAELRQQRWRRVVLSAGLACLSVVLGVVPAGAFLRSRHQLLTTSRFVASTENAALEASQAPRLSQGLQDLLLDTKQYESSAPAWLESLGMYTGSRVLPVLTRYTLGLMRTELVSPVLAHDLRELSDFGMRYAALPHALPTAPEHAAFYDALKLHLLLSEPTLKTTYASWVEAQLTNDWQTIAGRSAAELARTYASGSQRYQELAFARDAEVVQRVRAALNRASAAQQALDAIVAHVGTLGYDLDLAKLAGYTPALTGSRRVRGAFTRRGWETSVRELFASGAPDHVDELWVLGQTDAAQSGDHRARLAELETLYFHKYIEEWRGFLDGVRTKSPRNAGAEALALLSELTSGEPTPLARLFMGVYDNVHLPRQPSAANMAQAALNAVGPKPSNDVFTRIWDARKALPGKAGAVVASLETTSDPSRVAAAFESFTSFGVSADAGGDGGSRAHAPVPYDAYREQLSYLRDALQLGLDNPAERSQLDARVQTALVRVRGLIDSQPPAWRPVFETLLWPPIRGLHEGAGHDNAAWLGGQWCNEVVAPFLQTLLGRFPFSTNGRDARLDDFDAFYRPADGLLWKFTAGTLNDQVELRGTEYEYTPKFEHGAGLYSRGLLEFLNRSRAITNAFYPASGAAAGAASARGPRLDFSVRLHAASSRVETTTFSVGGASISYDNGPLRWQNLSWPGPDPNRGASFSVHGRAIRAGNDLPGPWGLFRLLESGEVQRAGDDTIRVQWHLPADDLVVWIELRPARTDSPWLDVEQHAASLRLLRLLRGGSATVPHRISTAQTACVP